MRITYRREVHPGGGHESLRVWVNGALAGAITVRADEERGLLDMIEGALVENSASGPPDPDVVGRRCPECAGAARSFHPVGKIWLFDHEPECTR